jgi:signal transduction histidine kinase
MVQYEPRQRLQDALDHLTALRERFGIRMRAQEQDEIDRGLDDVRATLVTRQEQVERLDGVLEQRDTDIDRLRSSAARTVLAEARSRHSLATELQAGLAQYLALAKLRLAALRGTEDSELRAALAQIEALVDQAERSLRAVTLQISPPSLFEFGLVPALEWLAEEMGRRFDLTVEILDEDSPSVDEEEVRVLVYRCVRELLINVAQHAEVLQAKVRLFPHDDALHVIVSDHGRGFDTLTVESSSSSLFGLREQLTHVGGELLLTSSPEHGTSALVSVPLSAARVLHASGKSDGA